MNTWPISVETKNGWTYLGIPDRLGTGRPYQINDSFRTLEEIGGDDWSAAILQQLLPSDRTWAWWTRNEVYKSTHLPTNRAGDVVNHRTLSHVVVRRLLREQMTLAFVPSQDRASQMTVAEWAGLDTEQVPDQIWTAPDVPQWNTDAIVSWCRDEDQWPDAKTVPHQPAERIVTLFDQLIFCALPDRAAALVRSGLKDLGIRWGLSVIPGPTEYAWAVRPKR
jgi:hypothetical protein